MSVGQMLFGHRKNNTYSLSIDNIMLALLVLCSNLIVFCSLMYQQYQWLCWYHDLESEKQKGPLPFNQKTFCRQTFYHSVLGQHRAMTSSNWSTSHFKIHNELAKCLSAKRLSTKSCGAARKYGNEGGIQQQRIYFNDRTPPPPPSPTPT